MYVGSGFAPETPPPEDSGHYPIPETNPQHAASLLETAMPPSPGNGCSGPAGLDQPHGGALEVPQAERAEPPQIAASEPSHVLIAVKGGLVKLATAYWVEDRTLHYLTPQGDHNQVSLDLVDRNLSVRLNQGSAHEFVPPE